MFKIEGLWSNSDDSIIIKFTKIPDAADNFAIEYKTNEETVDSKIHLSNTDNVIYHLIDYGELFGNGFIKFNSDNEILIDSEKIQNLLLIRQR